jgi:hypothetical protein
MHFENSSPLQIFARPFALNYRLYGQGVSLAAAIVQLLKHSRTLYNPISPFAAERAGQNLEDADRERTTPPSH